MRTTSSTAQAQRTDPPPPQRGLIYATHATDVHETISVLRDEESNVDGLPLRELSGLDKALQTTRGHLEVNLAILSENDEEIGYSK